MRAAEMGGDEKQNLTQRLTVASTFIGGVAAARRASPDAGCQPLAAHALGLPPALICLKL